MEIQEGDIVRRKKMLGKSIDDPWWKMTASNLFYDGFYMVLQVLSTKKINNKGKYDCVTVCKIMSHDGQLNWISSKYLKKIL